MPMNLSTLAGNQRIKDRLSRREWDRGLSHAYIISGPAGSGRHALARRLAAAMLCTGGGERPCGTCPACLKTEKGIHPDFSVTAGPEAGKPITVDQVRALRSDAYIRPNEGERKVYLLEEADRMNPSAQNAMLKLLEEGPAYAAFLLIAGNAGGLLQTVRSRCEELALTPVEGEERPALDPEQLEQAERLAAALERAGELELLETALSVLDVKRSREELSAFLDALERALGARAVRGGERRRLMHAVDLVNRLRDAARLNVSAGQLSGWLCCGMFGQER
ncbi:DNA polymerase III subunit delta [Oscillospiraceae bacterium 44-34]